MSPVAVTTGVPANSPSSAAAGAVSPPEHGGGRHQVGQGGPLQAGHGQEVGVVGHPVDGPVVGHPVQGDGVVGGPGQPGEPQVEVVGGLEEDRRRPGRRRAGCSRRKRMWPTGSLPDRLGTPPVAADPLGRLAGVVAQHVDRAPHRPAHRPRPPRVHPHDGRADGPRPRRRPAPSRTTGRCSPTPTTWAGSTPLSARALRAEVVTADHHSSGSCSAPPPGNRSRATGREGVGHHPPGRRHHGHLGPPGAQVHRQHVGVGVARGVGGAQGDGRRSSIARAYRPPVRHDRPVPGPGPPTGAPDGATAPGRRGGARRGGWRVLGGSRPT